MDCHLIEDLALSVRQQLRPGLSPAERVPLERLLHDVTIAELTVRATTDDLLPHHTWGMTTFERDRAWIWLNGEAWREVRTGTPRTRFTLAHELGHVVLHGEDIVDLFTRPIPEHHEQLEAEANRFAAHLLIPDASRKRLSGSQLKAEALAKRFNVSLKMVDNRLREWGLVDGYVA